MTTQTTRQRASWLRPLPPPGLRRKTALAAGAGIVTASLLAGGAAIIAATPSLAATHGHGWDIGDGWLGQEMVGSVATYCLQITASPPTGSTSFVGNVQYSTMSADNNARVNFAVTEYGQRADNNWAAATHLFVWSLADAAEYNSHGMSGDDYYVARAPSSQRADILNKLAYIRSQAAGVTAGSVGSGTGILDPYVDPRNNYVGTITVRNLNPADATGILTLTNGVFTANGTNQIAGARNGSVFQVRGIPPEGATTYKIQVRGAFTAAGGYAGRIGLYQTPGQQDTAGPGPQGVSSFNLFAEDPFGRSTLFQPVVSTQVTAKFVQKGELFRDTLQFATAADEDGLNNPWQTNPVNGRFAPITAKGVLYGPFTQQPAQSATVPAGAPIAARATVTTTADAVGPNRTYEATGDSVAEEAGFYTWVWTVARADQIPAVQQFLPPGYVYTDPFGQAVETHVSPTGVEATTKVSAAETGLGMGITDEVDVRLVDGAWLRNVSGQRIPVTLSGTAYIVPGDTAPAVTSTVPADAQVVGRTSIVVDRPGKYVSPVINAPKDIPGYMTWVWEIKNSAQPAQYRGYVAEWADQFGLTAETTRILAPEVVTKAVEEIAATDTATDTATVSGYIPADPTSLTFEAFRQPQLGDPVLDADGNAVLDADGNPVTLTEADITGEPVCTPANRVFDTNATPITVTAAGDYVSAPAQLDRVGTYFWVETLRASTGTVIHQGECGAEGETTVVSLADVTTRAMPEAAVTDPATDTAIVDGLVPTGATLVFAAYRQPQLGDPVLDADGNAVLDADGNPVTLTEADLTGEPVCTPDTLVADTVAAPVALTAGLNELTEYVSPAVEFQRTGTVYWVERMLDRDGNVLVQGECGAEGETTVVSVAEVTTKATAESPRHDAATDTAIVDGLVPTGATLVFEAYRQPETGDPAYETVDVPVVDQDGNPVLDADGNPVLEQQRKPVLDAAGEPVLLTEDDITGAPVCTPDTLVGETSESPVALTAGLNEQTEYLSPELVFDADGTVYWIEKMLDRNGNVLHAGECGLPDETTLVSGPTLKTKATTNTFLQESARDIATVTGLVPQGTYLVFEAFQQRGAQPTCTADTRVFDTHATPITVEQPGEFESPEVIFPASGTYYWVASLYKDMGDEDPILLTQDECGDPDETTIVGGLRDSGAKGTMASAGFDTLGPLLFGGLLLLGGVGVVALVALRRRKQLNS